MEELKMIEKGSPEIIGAGCWTALTATAGGGDTIWARGLPPTKARYCSMVSWGGVVTGKSNYGIPKSVQFMLNLRLTKKEKD